MVRPILTHRHFLICLSFFFLCSTVLLLYQRCSVPHRHLVSAGAAALSRWALTRACRCEVCRAFSQPERGLLHPHIPRLTSSPLTAFQETALQGHKSLLHQRWALWTRLGLHVWIRICVEEKGGERERETASLIQLLHARWEHLASIYSEDDMWLWCSWLCCWTFYRLWKLQRIMHIASCLG